MAKVDTSSENAFVGSPAPEFALEDERGALVGLNQMLTKGPALVIFYPGDFTPVCTKQLCSYRDSLESFQRFGVQLIGISKNNPKEHAEFKSKYAFQFPLLSDPDRKTMRRYGVTSLLMFGGTSRAVFIVSKTGKILYRYVEATTLTHRNPNELVQALQFLRNQGAL